MNSLSGKRILVTGASSGIGKTISQSVASLGASVILLGRNLDRLKETYHLLEGEGHEYYSVDLTVFSSVEEIVNSTVTKGGRISGLVYSAGIEKTVPLKGSTPLIFKEVFEINVFAAFEIARIIAKKGIVDPTGASFIFISSILGRFGSVGNIVYCSSKSALLAGVKAMALELAPRNIRCNCILPGIVETRMMEKVFESYPPQLKENITNKYPLGLGKPSDISALASFLLSDNARWITGGEYVIDGGYSAQ